MTKTLPVSEVKMKLTALVKAVGDCDDDVVIITRNGRPAAVILSYRHYEGLQETIEVLSDEDLMKQIRADKKAEQQGDVRGIPMEDVFRDLPDTDEDGTVIS